MSWHGRRLQLTTADAACDCAHLRELLGLNALQPLAWHPKRRLVELQEAKPENTWISLLLLPCQGDIANMLRAALTSEPPAAPSFWDDWGTAPCIWGKEQYERADNAGAIHQKAVLERQAIALAPIAPLPLWPTMKFEPHECLILLGKGPSWPIPE
jgi:hypothetical protein